MEIKPWIILESQTILSNKWLSVRADKCKIPESDIIIDDFYVIERPDSVYIVPITRNLQVVLVKQYRHATGQIIYELPAGYINQGETPQQAAERELLEETGYVAKRTESLGMVYTSPAVLTNKSYMFLCRNLECQNDPQREITEKIELVTFGLDELVSIGIDDHIIVDANSVSALLLAYQRIMDNNE